MAAMDDSCSLANAKPWVRLVGYQIFGCCFAIGLLSFLELVSLLELFALVCLFDLHLLESRVTGLLFLS